MVSKGAISMEMLKDQKVHDITIEMPVFAYPVTIVSAAFKYQKEISAFGEEENLSARSSNISRTMQNVENLTEDELNESIRNVYNMDEGDINVDKEAKISTANSFMGFLGKKDDS